jgi:hypothetical protein
MSSQLQFEPAGQTDIDTSHALPLSSAGTYFFLICLIKIIFLSTSFQFQIWNHHDKNGRQVLQMPHV